VAVATAGPYANLHFAQTDNYASIFINNNWACIIVKTDTLSNMFMNDVLDLQVLTTIHNHNILLKNPYLAALITK